MNRPCLSLQQELDFFAPAKAPVPLPLALPAQVAAGWDGSCGELRAVRVGEALTRAQANTSQLAADYWHAAISRAPWFTHEREMLVVALLDTRLRAFGFSLVAIGSLNEAVAHPREVMRPVIAAPSYAFILFHNHPSGVTEPSEADLRLTRRLKECAALFQIKLLDHLIMPSGGTPEERKGFFSFADAGIL